jgi:heme oxygenase (biliverdin-IX-beta and delta-forming)
MNETQRRWTLRKRTAEAHAVLDEAIGAFDTREDYERYLLAMYAFRQPVEHWLQGVAWPQTLGNWRPRAISDALTRDLADLALQPPAGPAFTVEPELSRLMGALYVLEGSALGAQLLLTRAQALGLDDRFGARHLAIQANVDSWRGFLDQLESADPFDIETATAASLATFDAAAQAFQKV